MGQDNSSVSIIDSSQDMTVEKSLAIIKRARQKIQHDDNFTADNTLPDLIDPSSEITTKSTVTEDKKKARSKKVKKWRRTIAEQNLEISEELQKNKERKKTKMKRIETSQSSTSEEEEKTVKKAETNLKASTSRRLQRKSSEDGTSDDVERKAYPKKKNASEMDLDKIQLSWDRKMKEDMSSEKSDGSQNSESDADNSEWKDYYGASNNSPIEDGEVDDNNNDEDESLSDNDERTQKVQKPDEHNTGDDRSDSDGNPSNKETTSNEAAESEKKQPKNTTGLRGKAKRGRKAGRYSAYDKDYVVPEEVTVDYYGTLRLPVELRYFDYEHDTNSYHPLTGWERLDDF